MLATGRGEVDVALGTRRAATATVDWEAALADWTRGQLDAGAADIHARAREHFDRVLLQTALEHTDGHRGEAAARLGVGRNTLARKLKPGQPGGA